MTSIRNFTNFLVICEELQLQKQLVKYLPTKATWRIGTMKIQPLVEENHLFRKQDSLEALFCSHRAMGAVLLLL